MHTFYIFLFYYFVAGQNDPVKYNHESSRYVLGLLTDLSTGVPSWLTTKDDCIPSGDWPEWDKSCHLTFAPNANPKENHVQSAYIDTTWIKENNNYETAIKFDRGLFGMDDLYLKGAIEKNCDTCKSTCTDCASRTLDGKCVLFDPEVFKGEPQQCAETCKAYGRNHRFLFKGKGGYFCTDAGSPVTTIEKGKMSDAWEINFMYWKDLAWKQAQNFQYNIIDCSLPENDKYPAHYCWYKSKTAAPTKSIQGYSYIVTIKHRKTGKWLTVDKDQRLVLKTAAHSDFPLSKAPKDMEKLKTNSFVWVMQYYSYRWYYTWKSIALISAEFLSGAVICLGLPPACGIVSEAIGDVAEVAEAVELGEAATDEAAVAETEVVSGYCASDTSVGNSWFDPMPSFLIRTASTKEERIAFSTKIKSYMSRTIGAKVKLNFISTSETTYYSKWFQTMVALAVYATTVVDGIVNFYSRRRLAIVPQMPQRTPLLSIAHLPDNAYQAGLWPESCFERPLMRMSYTECLAGVGGFDSELCGRVGGKVDGVHWVDIGKEGEEYCEIRMRIPEGSTIDDYSEPSYPLSIMKMISSTDTEEHNAEFQEHHRVDLGCGPGNPGPSGCDDQCGSTKIDLGCGCGVPGPSGCDYRCGSTKADLGCGCGVPGPSGCDNQCGSLKVDDGCGCGITCPIVTCTNGDCPAVDCVQSNWVASGACSVTCGEGTQTQTRSVLQPAERGGTCGPNSRTVTCTNGACPAVDCLQSAWVAFGACSVTCGEGTQTQIRSILHQAKNGGASCGSHSRTVSCTRGSCPMNQSQSLTTSFIKKPITIKVFASIGFIAFVFLVAKAVFSTPDYEKIPGANI